MHQQIIKSFYIPHTVYRHTPIFSQLKHVFSYYWVFVIPFSKNIIEYELRENLFVRKNKTEKFIAKIKSRSNIVCINFKAFVRRKKIYKTNF
jgi:hypothetical protein